MSSCIYQNRTSLNVEMKLWSKQVPVHAVWLGERASENEKRVKFVFLSSFMKKNIINEREKNEVREKVKMAKWICSQCCPFCCRVHVRLANNNLKFIMKNSFFKMSNLTKGIWHNKQLREEFLKGVSSRLILQSASICCWFFIIYYYFASLIIFQGSLTSYFIIHLFLLLFFAYLLGIFLTSNSLD